MATTQTPGIINGARSTVTNWFENSLGREPKQEGLDFWSNALDSGQNPNSVYKSFTQAAINNGETLRQPGDAQSQPAQQQQIAAPAPTTAQAPEKAATYQAAQLSDPTKWNVTPNQTAAGLVTQYTNPNSPIIQSAMTRAREQQNANGTLNSSMAETAGTKAAYDAAIPLAQQDAQTYSKAAGYNADESNQFAVQNATFQNQAGQSNANAQNTLTGQKLASDTNLATANIGANTQLATAKLSADTQRFVSTLSSNTQQAIAGLDSQSKMALAQLDSGTKLQLQQLDGQNKQLLQTNASAANAFAAYMQQIANITGSTTMDVAAKQTATQNAITNLNQQLQTYKELSGIDLSQYFSPANFTQASPAPAPPPTSNDATRPES